MSIQTELTRITNAKAAIKTAIEGKGVTVPDGTLLDGMAALIEAIEAGGNTNVIMGSFIPASSGVIEIDLTELGYNYERYPKARFLFEDDNYSMNSDYHTCRRTIAVFDISGDVKITEVDQDSGIGFTSLSVYQNNGDIYTKYGSASVSKFFSSTTNPSGSSSYNAMNGRIYKNNMAVIRFFAFDPTTDYKYGCIVGRNYRWGVIF